MTFEATNEKIIIVVTNYLYSSAREFENDEFIKANITNYKLKKCIPNINTSEPIPKPVLEQLQSSLPIVTFETEDQNFKVTYNDLEKNISFEICNLNEPDFEMLKMMVENFVDPKMSDLRAIGINFISQFNLGNNKLKLLNDKIETYMPNFKKNRTFQLTILLQLDDCVATYKIRKISGGDDTKENRIYQIDANFHFDLSICKTQRKIEKITNLMDNLNKKYLPIFKTECNNILAMNDEKK